MLIFFSVDAYFFSVEAQSGRFEVEIRTTGKENKLRLKKINFLGFGGLGWPGRSLSFFKSKPKTADLRSRSGLLKKKINSQT